MKVYLDNAATTQMDEAVIEVMTKVMKKNFGNPSSIHSFGRESRSLIETARKNISAMVGVNPAEIIFTSGGTEADNMAIRCGMLDLGIKHAITTKLEHHAVGHTLEILADKGDIKLSYVDVNDLGQVDLVHLNKLLSENERSFVSLMHANNEIGTMIDLKEVGEICKKHSAIFHSDTVQTMCHYPFNLKDINIHFATCSAHKFHGPKGIGWLYVNQDVDIKPLIHGGSQERNMRGGTENLLGIVGLEKAMEVAHNDIQAHMDHVKGLKSYMIDKLKSSIPGDEFNGDAEGESLYTVLNVSFPKTDNASMLLFSLDLHGVAASGGSACTSGSNQGSHVLRGISADMNRPSLRFSFSRMNSKDCVNYAVEKLELLFKN